MPSLDLYRKIHGALTIGETHKLQSDMVMNATWNNDIGSRIGYLYDYYHDLESYEKFKLRDLHPENDDQKIPIDIKFQEYSSQTYDKDVVSKHLVLRPGQKCNVPYYQDTLGKFMAIFPTGLYVDIEDESGQFNKWLVVGEANFYSPQFPTYELLPCDKVIQWVYKGKKYQMAGCLRSQNSYNSGVWRDYRVESIENVEKAILPMNEVSELIMYNQRLIIDNIGITNEPLAWRVSKYTRTQQNGVMLITFAQDQFDETHDYIEHLNPDDPTSPIIGMWASYFEGDIAPVDIDKPQLPTTRPVMSYKGRQDFTVKVGGNPRHFVVRYYDIDNNEVDYREGEWSIKVDDEIYDGELISIEPTGDNGHAKVRLAKKNDENRLGLNKLIGKKCTVSFKSIDGIETHIDMNIAGL